MDDYVFLDPIGGQDLGLVLLVLRPAGVHYASQIAGYATETRSAVGFVIPLGQRETEKLLIEFFEQEFAGYPRGNWTPKQLDRLRQILAHVKVWKTYAEGGPEDEPGSLTLDTARVAELTEAWIPVKSAYGSAVLLFKNSD